jgi:hypothetical protein
LSIKDIIFLAVIASRPERSRRVAKQSDITKIGLPRRADKSVGTPRNDNYLQLKSVTVLCCALLLLLNSCSTTTDIASTETNSYFNFTPETRVMINAPAEMSKPTLLILYALPNGNTIEMTAGRKLSKGLDWHYDIQHIAAQVRFLRRTLSDVSVVVAYLEAAQKSWPAWRKKYEYKDDNVARLVDFVRFETGNPSSVILAGHSGGGSFLNGCINAYDTIPDYISRIVYLDANYSYEDSLNHGRKLMQWLRADTSHKLSVIAYDDREIIYNGKKVIGPTGGTFRATQRMVQYFREYTDIKSFQDSTIIQYESFNNRSRFIVHSNPDTLILHTVLVERNGLIHSVLFNTKHEEINYKFSGPRAYQEFITEE